MQTQLIFNILPVSRTSNGIHIDQSNLIFSTYSLYTKGFLRQGLRKICEI